MLGTLVHLGVAYHYVEMMPKSQWPNWFRDGTLQDAMERVGEGYPGEIAMAEECISFYKLVTAGEPFVPKYVEHEFEARVGDLDPNGPDEDGIHYVNDFTGKEFNAPTLNNEVVTVRSDVVGERDGSLWIRDHKTKIADWRIYAYKDRLPPWKEGNEFSLNWQALMNLHVVRHCLGVDQVAGFEINRIKRDAPFDRDCHVLKIPEKPYKDTPRVIREAVRRERQLALKATKGEKPTPFFWECFSPYPCDYLPLCKNSKEDELVKIIKSDFRLIH